MHFARSSAAILLVAFAAGCGGSHRAASPPPTFPRGTASRLATLSDAVAAALDRGDGCAARLLATSLRRQTAAAIDNGRVPPALRTPLRRAAGDLVARIHCTPPPQPQPPEQEHGKGEHGHHGKGHGEGD